ncbi:MAG: hypothetical protein ACI4JB_04335 [Porcipelethomonas sp.]
MINHLRNIFFTVTACCLFLTCGCSSKQQYSGYHKITLVTDAQPTASVQNSRSTEPTVTAAAVSQPSEEMTVYYTKTGKKYHYINPCGSGEYFECTLREAEEKGLEPCGKCVK